MRRIVWFSIVTVGLALGVSMVVERERVAVILGQRYKVKEQEVRVLELNARGVELLNGQQVEQALTFLEEAYSMDPANPMVRRNLSLALARFGQASGDRGRAVEARTSFERSLELWDRNPEALELMAVAEYEDGRYREALEYAAKLSEIYPGREDIARFTAAVSNAARETEGMVAERGQFFRLLYSGQRRLQFEGELIALLQTQMDSLTAALGIFPDQAIDVLILTEDLGDRAHQVDPMVEGLYDGRIRLYYGSIQPGDAALVRTVRHEMVHALLHRSARGNLPTWFQEGVAQRVGEEPGPRELDVASRVLKGALQDGRSVDLGSLTDSFLVLPERERAEAYAASLLFVDHLMERYGRRIIPILVLDLKAGRSLDEALVATTGKGMTALQREFYRSFIGRG